MKPTTESSLHRMPDGTIKRVKRMWDEEHIASGYHEQIWGEHSTLDHELHGKHEIDAPLHRDAVDCLLAQGLIPAVDDVPALNGKPCKCRGYLLIEHIEGEPVLGEREDGATVLIDGSWTHGPEFKLTWPNGSSATVVCADIVREYLRQKGAKA